MMSFVGGTQRLIARQAPGLTSPVAELVTAGFGRPRVPLFADEAIATEAQQRRACDRLDRAIPRRDRSPPVHSRAFAGDDRLTEPAFRVQLVRERPRDVLVWRLPRAKWVRIEHRVVGIESCDSADVALRPRTRPDLGPGLRGSGGAYFATSMARLSRMTITLT